MLQERLLTTTSYFRARTWTAGWPRSRAIEQCFRCCSAFMPCSARSFRSHLHRSEWVIRRRSPGNQIHHSVITSFRHAAQCVVSAALPPRSRWREPQGGPELSAQPSLLPSPEPDDLITSSLASTPPPRSRHLRPPGAQLHHSVITSFRPTALVGRLGSLTTTITMARPGRRGPWCRSSGAGLIGQ